MILHCIVIVGSLSSPSARQHMQNTPMECRLTPNCMNSPSNLHKVCYILDQTLLIFCMTITLNPKHGANVVQLAMLDSARAHSEWTSQTFTLSLSSSNSVPWMSNQHARQQVHNPCLRWRFTLTIALQKQITSDSTHICMARDLNTEPSKSANPVHLALLDSWRAPVSELNSRDWQLEFKCRRFLQYHGFCLPWYNNAFTLMNTKLCSTWTFWLYNLTIYIT